MKNEIKEDLKEILLMGLGAISLTGDKAKDLKKELLEKGKDLYEAGQVKNEELKHTLKGKLDNIKTKEKTSKNDIIEAIKNMSAEEKKEISKYLKTTNDKKE